MTNKKETTNENLIIFEKVRTVPEQALKKITGGRLKGMNDINPMWRIEELTKNFGVCGIGWKVIVANKEFVNGHDGNVSCFVDIELFVKVDGVWSDAIIGTGGSSFITKESNGYYTSDECYKMALTDAISVACKMLGFGADVYYNVIDTKYTKKENENNIKNESKENNKEKTEKELKIEILEKYKQIHGDDKGVVDFVDSQLSKGYNYNQINTYLSKQLNKK